MPRECSLNGWEVVIAPSFKEVYSEAKPVLVRLFTQVQESYFISHSRVCALGPFSMESW